MWIGAFGQDFVRGNVIFCGLVVGVLTGCGSAGDGRYIGTLKTVQGACGPGFDAQGNASATLMIRGNQALFAPSDGVEVLGGQVGNAGHVLAGSNAPGADKKPFPQVFEGNLDGERVHGHFATPRCRASAELTKG